MLPPPFRTLSSSPLCVCKGAVISLLDQGPVPCTRGGRHRSGLSSPAQPEKMHPRPKGPWPYLGATDSGQSSRKVGDAGSWSCAEESAMRRGLHLAVQEVLTLSIPPATAASFSLPRQLPRRLCHDLGEQCQLVCSLSQDGRSRGCDHRRCDP